MRPAPPHNTAPRPSGRSLSLVLALLVAFLTEGAGDTTLARGAERAAKPRHAAPVIMQAQYMFKNAEAERTARIPSPDRRWELRFSRNDADLRLDIWEVADRRRVARFDCWQSFCWMNGARSELLVATSGIYGVPGVWLWRGPRRTKCLASKPDDGNHEFTLVRLSRDGRWVEVEYLDLGPDPLRPTRRIRLLLPGRQGGTGKLKT